jgi:hypothetical protein
MLHVSRDPDAKLDRSECVQQRYREDVLLLQHNRSDGQTSGGVIQDGTGVSADVICSVADKREGEFSQRSFGFGCRALR